MNFELPEIPHSISGKQMYNLIDVDKMREYVFALDRGPVVRRETTYSLGMDYDRTKREHIVEARLNTYISAGVTKDQLLEAVRNVRIRQSRIEEQEREDQERRRGGATKSKTATFEQNYTATAVI